MKYGKQDWIPIFVLKSKKFDQPDDCESRPEEEYSYKYLKRSKKLHYILEE